MGMVGNEKGGILSKVFIIPAGVVVIISVFVAGYFMGKREGARTSAAERPPALPELVSQYLPDKEDLTFYKTLTEKGEKTLSVDLKPRPKTQEAVPVKREEPQAAIDAGKGPAVQKQEPVAKIVQPKPVQTVKKEPAPAPAPAPKGRFTVQVGAYPDRTMAEEEVRNMKRRGYAAFLVATNIPEKGTWYRVRVGSFANKQAAEKLAGELKSRESVEGFVTAE